MALKSADFLIVLSSISLATLRVYCYTGNHILETYPSPRDGSHDRNGTKRIFFALILSSHGQFESFGAVAGVRVALDRINQDPYLLQNYTLGYTLTNSSVSHCHVSRKNNYERFSSSLMQ